MRRRQDRGEPWPAPRRPSGVVAPAAVSLPLEADTSKAPAERRKGAYVLPPVTLLDATKDQGKIDERDLMDAARLLEEKCREFLVEGTVVQIHPGPVVTTYEFKPDAGVKYSRVTGSADDLCLAMKAESVLIDRIPGKSTVGHPDSQRASRDHYAPRTARIGHLYARELKADHGVGQNDSRRALHQRYGDDAALAHCRVDGRRQVRQRQRDDFEHPVPLHAR
jgi:hypothetical protein